MPGSEVVEMLNLVSLHVQLSQTAFLTADSTEHSMHHGPACPLLTYLWLSCMVLGSLPSLLGELVNVPNLRQKQALQSEAFADR